MKKFKVTWVEQQEWECVVEAESHSEAIRKWNSGELVSSPSETNWHCVETDSVESHEIEDSEEQ